MRGKQTLTKLNSGVESIKNGYFEVVDLTC